MRGGRLSPLLKKLRSVGKVKFPGYAVARAHKHGDKNLSHARSVLAGILKSKSARLESKRAAEKRKPQKRKLSPEWYEELREAGFSDSEIRHQGKKLAVENPEARNPVQFLPPKGRSRKWQRIETTTRGKKTTLVSKRQRDRAESAQKRRTWENGVADGLGISLAQARAWKREIKARVRREFARDTPARKKRWSLKRRLFVAEKMMRELAGVEGSDP